MPQPSTEESVRDSSASLIPVRRIREKRISCHRTTAVSVPPLPEFLQREEGGSPEGPFLGVISPTHCGVGLLGVAHRFLLGPGMGVVGAGNGNVDEISIPELALPVWE
jgi:hypothetical protein